MRVLFLLERGVEYRYVYTHVRHYADVSSANMIPIELQVSRVIVGICAPGKR